MIVPAARLRLVTQSFVVLVVAEVQDFHEADLDVSLGGGVVADGMSAAVPAEALAFDLEAVLAAVVES